MSGSEKSPSAMLAATLLARARDLICESSVSPSDPCRQRPQYRDHLEAHSCHPQSRGVPFRSPFFASRPRAGEARPRRFPARPAAPSAAPRRKSRPSPRALTIPHALPEKRIQGRARGAVQRFVSTIRDLPSASYSAAQGVRAGMERLNRAADTVARSGPAESNAAVLHISDEARAAASANGPAPDLQEGLIDSRFATYQVSANVRVLQTSDEMTRELLDSFERR